MPKKYKLAKTDFKCPECAGDCLYNDDLGLFVCNRPLVSAMGDVLGSCGKFYANKNKVNK